MLCFDSEVLSSVLRRLGEADVVKDGPLLRTYRAEKETRINSRPSYKLWFTHTQELAPKQLTVQSWIIRKKEVENFQASLTADYTYCGVAIPSYLYAVCKINTTA